jgi:hypothetical protein
MFARLIESPVFTKARRSPFRNGNRACVGHCTRQNGCPLQTKSPEIRGRPKDINVIDKVINMHGTAEAARRLIRERY